MAPKFLPESGGHELQPALLLRQLSTKNCRMRGVPYTMGVLKTFRRALQWAHIRLCLPLLHYILPQWRVQGRFYSLWKTRVNFLPLVVADGSAKPTSHLLHRLVLPARHYADSPSAFPICRCLVRTCGKEKKKQKESCCVCARRVNFYLISL